VGGAAQVIGRTFTDNSPAAEASLNGTYLNALEGRVERYRMRGIGHGPPIRTSAAYGTWRTGTQPEVVALSDALYRMLL